MITNRMIRDFFVDKGELIGSLGDEGSDEMLVKTENVGHEKRPNDEILEKLPLE